MKVYVYDCNFKNNILDSREYEVLYFMNGIVYTDGGRGFYVRGVNNVNYFPLVVYKELSYREIRQYLERACNIYNTTIG
jgi:hypothetical protein